MTSRRKRRERQGILAILRRRDRTSDTEDARWRPISVACKSGLSEHDSVCGCAVFQERPVPCFVVDK
jgi:hypothetical protein